ncbi:MAG: hypothetical protein KC547_04900 [Anaerolineae bacterium]|nr:hypothetical protein [Anaerolineae bacterium]MCA9909571.1 hypothetical protein [Anaerolineae bacterium]
MSAHAPRPDDTGAIYQIRVAACLDARQCAAWFDGMSITLCADGSTVLQGWVADQAALYGLIARLRDLALPLVAVLRVE